MAKGRALVKKAKGGICPEIGCKNPATSECKYCKQLFCKEHVSPKLAGTMHAIKNIKTNEPEKYKKYIEDYRRMNGHTCGAYTTIWNKEFDSRAVSKKERYQENLGKLVRSHHEKPIHEWNNRILIPASTSSYEDENFNDQNREYKKETKHFSAGLIALAIFIAITVIVFAVFHPLNGIFTNNISQTSVNITKVAITFNLYNYTNTIHPSAALSEIQPSVTGTSENIVFVVNISAKLILQQVGGIPVYIVPYKTEPVYVMQPTVTTPGFDIISAIGPSSGAYLCSLSVVNNGICSLTITVKTPTSPYTGQVNFEIPMSLIS